MNKTRTAGNMLILYAVIVIMSCANNAFSFFMFDTYEMDTCDTGLSFLVKLDSLRNLTMSNSESFLSEYANESARCLLPPEIIKSDFSFILDAHHEESPRIFLSTGEILPVKTEWRVLSNSGQSYNLPKYSFVAEFSLSGQLNVKVPSLHPQKQVSFNMNIRPDIASEIPPAKVADPFAQKYRTRIVITTEISHQAGSLSDYMTELVKDRYDGVTRINELEKLNAISLRCRTSSAFGNVTGYEYALVAFDRILRNSSVIDSVSGRKNTRAAEDVTVRYLIAMQTRTIVKDKAEALLQNVLRKFEVF